jgi:uncharacterized protein YdhG (YjbR/CyaY superfamily)
MQSKKVLFTSIDDYIATFPIDIQKRLVEIRTAVKAVAPKAEEKISYHMPSLVLNGPIIHFSAYKKHIGVYGTSYQILKQLKDEVAPYVQSKGTLQFPYDQPLPIKLIKKIVKLRVAENRAVTKLKSGRNKL